MSMNRIYIRCRGCGATLYLGKLMDEYHYISYDGRPLENKLNKFYYDHAYCDRPREDSHDYDEELFPLPEDCGGCPGSFDIVYEREYGIGIVQKYGKDESNA